ncbi:MAG: asparagine synthase-related protein [Planctomycetota bacterium]
MGVVEDDRGVLLAAPTGVADSRGEAAQRWCVVSAARIDDRPVLRDELERAGVPAGTAATDPELILSAYRCWGPECVDHLQGDFAFAIWDRARGRLFCARDRVGTVPFYYHHAAGSQFAFASEVGPILQLPGVSRDLDPLRVAFYLEPFFEDVERTFHASVKRLPPGHTLSVERTGATLRRYWSLDPRRELDLGSDAAYVEAFRDCFLGAVEDRLRGARRPGVLLSGGLDSACVLGAVRARTRAMPAPATPFATLSAVFPGCPQADERDYIESALADGGVDSHFVVADDLSPLGAIDEMFTHIDEPFHVPNLFVYWALARKAQGLGLDALLDGVDGDTTVSHGLEYLAEMFARRRWVSLLRATRALARRLGGSTASYLWRFAVRPNLVRARPFAVRPPRVIAASLVELSGWREERRAWAAAWSRPRSHREAHWEHLTSGLLPYYLEVNDQVAATFGLDHTHPYYDSRLMELCLALPADQRLRHGWDRRIQRVAAAGWVPSRIQWRVQKAYWGGHFEASLSCADEPTLERVVRDGPGSVFDFADRATVADSWGRCRRGVATAQDYMNVWVTSTLALWLECRRNGHSCRAPDAALEFRQL